MGIMDKIENLQQYEEAEKRVEELLPLVNDDMPTDDPNYIELVRLSNMVADYDEVHFSLFRSFDEILDAEYGKVGTPKREQFRKEVEAYRQAIEEVDKKIGLEKLETEEQYKWAINRIEELRPLITNDTPCYDHNSVEKELLSFMIMDYEEELCQEPKRVREGWAEAFDKYAEEGEDEMMLPDCVDFEDEE